MTHVDTPQSYCQGADRAARHHAAGRHLSPHVGRGHARSLDRHSSTAVGHGAGAGADASGPTERDPRRRKCSSASTTACCGTRRCEALRERVARGAGIALEQLHITCSHTHAAGLMDPGRADLPGGELIAPYLDVHGRARSPRPWARPWRRSRPLAIVYGQGRSSLARHRDFWDADNRQFVCGFNPDGPSDDTVLVARLTDERSRDRGHDRQLCLPSHDAGLGQHADQSRLCRRDARSGRKRHGAPCLFLQGASGDLGPRDGYVGDTARGRSQRPRAGLCGIGGARVARRAGPAIRIRRAGRVGRDDRHLEARAAAAGSAVRQASLAVRIRRDRSGLSGRSADARRDRVAAQSMAGRRNALPWPEATRPKRAIATRKSNACSGNCRDCVRCRRASTCRSRPRSGNWAMPSGFRCRASITTCCSAPCGSDFPIARSSSAR